MSRLLAALVLVAGVVHAHGGAFRPPPPRRPLPGDVGRPEILTRSTAPPSIATPPQPWEYWWRLNRAPFLRLRARAEERAGPRSPRADRARLRDEVLLPVMLEAFRSSDKDIRAAAAIALGKFRVAAARPLLLGVLAGDSDRQAREAAMLGLVLLRDPQLRDEFRRFVKGDKRELRERAWAVLGLGFLGDHGYLALLLREEGKPPGTDAAIKEIRACAALALGASGRGAEVPLVSTLIDAHADADARGLAGSALAHLRSPLAEPDLLRLIGDPKANPIARYGAAIAAGRVVRAQTEGILDRLGRKAARDRDPSMRSLLVMSLGRIGGDRAATHVVSAFRTAMSDRGFVYLALGIANVSGGGDVLVNLFDKERNATNRGACALGLALCAHDKAARRLREHVKRGNPGFVPHGVVALGLLEDKKALPLVREVLAKSRDPILRRAAVFSLALLNGGEAVPELVELLKDSKTAFLRGAIAAVLGEIGAGNAVEPLLAIYRDTTRTGEERAVALAALGRIGDVDELPLLQELAIDLNPHVQLDAIQELLRIL